MKIDGLIGTWDVDERGRQVINGVTQMKEDRSSYVKRVLPDLDLIREDLEATFVREQSDFHIHRAISRVGKLLEDLERAARASS